MDSVLAGRLNNLNAQNEALRQAEGEYLLKEAKRKTMEADLYRETQEGSQVTKMMEVYRMGDYKDFVEELAKLEEKFNFEKRRYSILENAFYAENSTFKNEMQLIKKESINT